MENNTKPKTFFNANDERIVNENRLLASIVGTLLLITVIIYIWLAPRGFELTDESFYLLSYTNWRNVVGSFTLFGIYFELPFRILGQNVSNIRIFSLILLLASSAFFSREIFYYIARRDSDLDRMPLSFLIIGMSSSLLYFGLRGGVRAPSYDTLALSTMLVSTGVILHLLERRKVELDSNYMIFLYGIVVGICGLTKLTTCLLLATCHLIFFMLVNSNWKQSYLVKIFLLIAAGLCFHFLVIEIVFTGWLDYLLEGISSTSSDGRHSPLSLLNWMRWQIQSALVDFLPLAVCVMLSFRFILKHTSLLTKNSLSQLILLLIIMSICIFVMIWREWTRFRLPVTGLVLWLLWTMECNIGKYKHLPSIKQMSLVGLLFIFPLIFSIGTDTGVLNHSQMALIFPVTAIAVQLCRMRRLSIISANALMTCSILLCLPALVIQLRTAFDIGYAFRQLSPLLEQRQAIHLGPAASVFLVDPRMGQDLRFLIDVARDAGFSPDENILDFTGVGPGLTYALAGRPVGAIWQIGGLPNREETSARLISKLQDITLRNAWILSADNDPSAITGWHQLLSNRLGEDSHQLYRSVTIHTRVESLDTISVQIWKPKKDISNLNIVSDI